MHFKHRWAQWKSVKTNKSGSAPTELRKMGKGQSWDTCYPCGLRSVKIQVFLVISLMSFAALSDNTKGVSTVNNGGKLYYSESNY